MGKGGEEKEWTLKFMAKMLEGRAKDGINATVTTTKKDGKETVTEIKSERPKGGKGKDKDKDKDDK